MAERRFPALCRKKILAEGFLGCCAIAECPAASLLPGTEDTPIFWVCTTPFWHREVFLRFLCAKTETAVRQNEFLLLILCALPKFSDF